MHPTVMEIFQDWLRSRPEFAANRVKELVGGIPTFTQWPDLSDLTEQKGGMFSEEMPEWAYDLLDATSPLGGVAGAIRGASKRALRNPLYHGAKDATTQDVDSIINKGFTRGHSAEVLTPGTSVSQDPVMSYNLFSQGIPFMLRAERKGRALDPQSYRNLSPEEYNTYGPAQNVRPTDILGKPNYPHMENEWFHMRGEDFTPTERVPTIERLNALRIDLNSYKNELKSHDTYLEGPPVGDKIWHENIIARRKELKENKIPDTTRQVLESLRANEGKLNLERGDFEDVIKLKDEALTLPDLSARRLNTEEIDRLMKQKKRYSENVGMFGNGVIEDETYKLASFLNPGNQHYLTNSQSFLMNRYLNNLIGMKENKAMLLRTLERDFVNRHHSEVIPELTKYLEKTVGEAKADKFTNLTDHLLNTGRRLEMEKTQPTYREFYTAKDNLLDWIEKNVPIKRNYFNRRMAEGLWVAPEWTKFK